MIRYVCKERKQDSESDELGKVSQKMSIIGQLTREQQQQQIDEYNKKRGS